MSEGGDIGRAATDLDAAAASTQLPPLPPVQTTVSPRLRVILFTLAALCLAVTLYLIRDWYPMNILCVLAAYLTSFTLLCLMSKLATRGGIGRAATDLPASDAGTPLNVQRSMLDVRRSSSSPRPSPAVARAIYINLLTTTKQRL